MVDRTIRGSSPMADRSEPGVPPPAEWLQEVEPPRRRDEGLLLLERLSTVTGLPPVMWSKRLIGFGRYAYTYESGRSGEWFMVGFSPGKREIAIHVLPGYRDLGEPLTRLGPHRLGKSCLYLSDLSRNDLDALDDIVRDGIDHLRANYPTFER